MRIFIEKYGEIAVSVYYTMSDVEVKVGSTEYGWKNLKNVTIYDNTSIGDGYVIKLPEPQKL